MVESISKFANDLGYGAVKYKISKTDNKNDGVLKEPDKISSVIAIEREQDIPNPIEFDDNDQKDQYMNDFLDHMDVTISSSSIKTQGRFLVGKAAIESRLPLEQFDINDLAGKAKNDLSLILSLSIIAANRVKEAYKNGEDLNETLKATVVMATALPVTEVKRNGTRDEYRDRYLNATHTVTFHNFVNPINVSIKFKKVYVAVEGETAQMFISFTKDKLFLSSLKKEYQKKYPDLSKKKPFEVILSSKNTISIDIGAGTTDVNVIVNGRANANISISVPYGYGSVLEDAVDVLQEKGYPILNRTQLEDFLKDNDPLGEERRKRVEKVVQEQYETLSDRIVAAVSRSLRKSGASAQAVSVSGGGSIPMVNSQLDRKLTEKINSYSGGNEDIPVLWIPKEYAQNMNCNGLEIVADHLFE